MGAVEEYSLAAEYNAAAEYSAAAECSSAVAYSEITAYRERTPRGAGDCPFGGLFYFLLPVYAAANFLHVLYDLTAGE